MVDAFWASEKPLAKASGCPRNRVNPIGAILYGMDYAWLADELSGGAFWQRTGTFDHYTATTIAAAIFRQDAQEQRAAA